MKDGGISSLEDSSMIMYYAPNLGRNATVNDLCNTILQEYRSGDNSDPVANIIISTNSVSHEVIGWKVSDSLIENLEVSGYIPEVGKIYNDNSTIVVSGMFIQE